MRYLRILLAAVSLTLVTLLFLNLSPAIITHAKWIAEWQFLPAVLSLNVIVIAAIVILTLLFGRVYCSVICPLGIAQDAVSGIANTCSKKRSKKPFIHRPANNILRYGVLAVFIVALVAGIGMIFTALAPYSAYGRIASNLLAPIAIEINNLLADGAAKENSFSYIHRPELIIIYPSLMLSVLTVLIIGALAWFRGRYYCNTVCPVGTLLGLLSRFSLYRPTIDNDRCVSCKLCSFKCRSGCIDAKNHAIDVSRCVMCLDCTAACSKGAIKWAWVNPFSSKPAPTPAPKKKKAAARAEATTPATPASSESDSPAAPSTDNSRRDFFAFAGAVLLANTIKDGKKREKKGDGGLAPLKEKLPCDRSSSIVPPGARSQSNFYKRCTGCQLCVSNCPNRVLRPSEDMSTLFQPEMSFERGFCRPECNKCSQVCPTGAICAITTAEKSNIKIGKAVCNHRECLPITDGVNCGHCARSCPTGAIKMVPVGKGRPEHLLKPIVDQSLCIGCGACEFYCPVRPHAAIHVEGLIDHQPLI